MAFSLISGTADEVQAADIDCTEGTVCEGTADSDVISGGEGDDTINAGNGRDTINGGEGDDTINGENDNDTISGGPGSNIIHGESGNDNIRIKAGHHTVRGGPGIDHYGFEIATRQACSYDEDDQYGCTEEERKGSLTIIDWDPTEKIDLRQILASSLLDPDETECDNIDRRGRRVASDLFHCLRFVQSRTRVNNKREMSLNIYIRSYSIHLLYIYRSEISRSNFLFPGDSYTQPALSSDWVGCNCTGTAANDNGGSEDGDEPALRGDAYDNVMEGLAGDDILRGWAGNDTLYGGDGYDALLGGRGADRLFGGEGGDLLRGGPGPDYL